MKKDIEWAKKKIKEIHTLTFDSYEAAVIANNKHFQMKNSEQLALINKIMEILDRLDEPEVLSKEWVAEHEMPISWMAKEQKVVRVEHLQNLLVPKQELPVIPQFVADWIEELKQDERPLYSVMSSLMNKTNHEWAVWKSANKNFSEIVAQAWLDGYEAAEEKEQKYRVIFPSLDENGKDFNYLAKGCYHKELWIEDARTDGLVWEERSSFTEDEIRDLDKGDILFEHFAVKVNELEE